MKLLCRSERGAVTIFFIVIFASIFSFVAIFIDFARIFAIQAKTEVLAHAASRSVMSAYDQQLVEEYGLFAYGETDGNYIMSKVLQDNLEYAKRSDDLPIIGARLDSSIVELQRPLGTYSVFEQQIREQMKYKAPIDFTIELVNRFKPMSQMMKETSNTVDLLGKLQKLYEQREAKFDQMLDRQRKSAQIIQSLSSHIPRAFEVTSEYGDYVYKYYASLEDDSGDDSVDDEEDEVDYSLDIIRFRSKAGSMFDDLRRQRQVELVQHAGILEEAKVLLVEAKQLNELMETTIEESELRSEQDGYNKVSQTDSTGGNHEIGNGSEIVQIRQKSRDLLISDELLADFEGDIVEQGNLFVRVNREVSSFHGMEGSVMSASASEGELNSVLGTLKLEVELYLQKYWNAGSSNILIENKRLLEEHRSSDEERKNIEAEANGVLKEATGLMKQITDLKNKLSEYQEEFDQLETYYTANREFNAAAGETSETSSVTSEEDPYHAGQEAMGGMDIFYGGIADLMKGMSDHAFQGEYIVNYYEFFDISTLDELLKESGTQKIDALSNSFAPKRQEVEYILYGFHNPVGNIAAAYGEIFTMRLAIRTMEGLVKNVAKGHPLLILAAALLHGVQHALKDMLDLAKEGSVYLSDYLRVKLSYRDHLRIFLLMHGRSEKRLSRMLAGIQNNTGISPNDRATYLKGEVTISLPLWFLPGVAKAMGGIGAIKGRVEGSTYYVTKQADFSY